MDTIDWETQQLKVFEALKEGNKALTQLHDQMPLEKVEEIMADTAENIAIEEVRKKVGLAIFCRECFFRVIFKQIFGARPTQMSRNSCLKTIIQRKEFWMGKLYFM